MNFKINNHQDVSRAFNILHYNNFIQNSMRIPKLSLFFS